LCTGNNAKKVLVDSRSDLDAKKIGATIGSAVPARYSAGLAEHLDRDPEVAVIDLAVVV
jgi:hypothetical protein